MHWSTLHLFIWQIMKKLMVFVTGDRKGIENNIRVCLSSNKCFVKVSCRYIYILSVYIYTYILLLLIDQHWLFKKSQVPIDPEYPNAKRNFWRVDESSITPKMLRRHFSDMAELFPGLPTTWDRKALATSSPVCPVKVEDRPIKFTGPFSIESLLKKDPRPQVRITVQQAALTPNSDLGFSNEFYRRDTDSLACLDRTNSQHNFYYMYKSVEEASWRKSAQRMDLSPELPRAQLYSPHFPNDFQTLLTKVSSSPPKTHELRYGRWWTKTKWQTKKCKCCTLNDCTGLYFFFLK